MMDKLWSSLRVTLGIALFVLFMLNYLVRVSDGTGSSTGIVFDYLFGGDLAETPASEQEEIDTLRARAEQGNARAQFNLAALRSTTGALREDAVEARDFAAGQMNPTQIAEAQRLAHASDNNDSEGWGGTALPQMVRSSLRSKAILPGEVS
jgi:hypothetical protein